MINKDLKDRSDIAQAVYDLILQVQILKMADRKTEPQTESTGSPIGDYRDGVGIWSSDCARKKGE